MKTLIFTMCALESVYAVYLIVDLVLKINKERNKKGDGE